MWWKNMSDASSRTQNAESVGWESDQFRGTYQSAAASHKKEKGDIKNSLQLIKVTLMTNRTQYPDCTLAAESYSLFCHSEQSANEIRGV